MELAQKMHPTLGATATCDHVLKVVYGVVREILNIIVNIVLNHFVGSGIYNLITYGINTHIKQDNKLESQDNTLQPYYIPVECQLGLPSMAN